MPDVSLDSVAGVVADSEQFGNELQSLHMLTIGLATLVHAVRKRESVHAPSAQVATSLFVGGATDEENEDLALVGCMFHWFGVSLCNYARLVGYIRAISTGEFTKTDLMSPKNSRRLAKSIGDYVESIPELAEVRIWRNKVAAHFAITDPRKEDNIATLDLSVMHPVSLESGVYHVGSLALLRTIDGQRHASDLPRWSLTQVFEAVQPRYWPNTVFTATGRADKDHQP